MKREAWTALAWLVGVPLLALAIVIGLVQLDDEWHGASRRAHAAVIADNAERDRLCALSDKC